MRAFVVTGVKVVFDFISLAFVLLRVWATRKKPKSSLRLTSHILLFSIVAMCVVMTAIFIKNVFRENQLIKKYSGNMALVHQHLENAESQKRNFVSHILYQLTLYLLKIAYLTHYAQLFVRTVTRKRYLMYAGAVVTFLCFIVAMIMHFTWCIPITKYWDLGSRCSIMLSFNAFAAFACMNIFSDLIILAIPLLVVSDLKLRRSERYALAGVFLLGSSSILTSIVRFAILGPPIKKANFSQGAIKYLGLLSHIEVLLGVIAFTLPAFRPYLSRMMGSTDQASSQKSWPSQESSGSGGHGKKYSAAAVRVRGLDEEADLEMDEALLRRQSTRG